MVFCPQCDAAVDIPELIDSGRHCPNCGGTLTRSDSVTWQNVARVANLAEAGFIADELTGLGINARVHQLEEFSAASDRWSSQYLIQVSSESAHDAADHIRQYLMEEPPGSCTVLDVFRLSPMSQEGYALSWRPVAMAPIVGVAGFLFGQQFSEQTVRHRIPSNDLSVAVGTVGRPFSTESAANQPRHRLSFDVRRQMWTLDSDRDQDGVYESRQRFTASGDAR